MGKKQKTKTYAVWAERNQTDTDIQPFKTVTALAFKLGRPCTHVLSFSLLSLLLLPPPPTSPIYSHYRLHFHGFPKKLNTFHFPVFLTASTPKSPHLTALSQSFSTAAASKMKKRDVGTKLRIMSLAIFSSFFMFADSQAISADASVMLALKQSLNPPKDIGWSDPDPCKWTHVACSEDKRVTRIQIGHQSLQGTLVSNLSSLSQLERLELQFNNLSGPLPSLSGLSSLQVVMLSDNQFSSVPEDFFSGLSSLQSVDMDNNPFSSWEIPESITNASSLQNFSANSANISGKIPGFFGPDEFPGLVNLHLAFNNLEGELPASFSGSQIQSLWVNGQKSVGKLDGRINVIQNMTLLREIWLHSNAFSGPLPNFSGLTNLQALSLRDNMFTGIVPLSLVNLGSLEVVNLTNNFLQGPIPVFKAQ
ncbi:hypothetical protein Nepgr_006991 [Nepenthes gracilis]|uniref:Leucine-rich repeat-containing N-terminal plant-type domain-containing protein n=1 Tax=Nepenthes gracilis TaxID=150966 RepID=A0AAD3S6P8_NEPGR|nr:hypothetical protein Nepgr_006991 [Nepenthes gracilis]